MQVDPIKPALTVPEIKRLKLKFDKSHSILLQFCFNFAFNFNLRRYKKADNAANEKGPGAAGGSTEASKRRKMKTGAGGSGSKENA